MLAHERARSDRLAVGALLVAPQGGRALFRTELTNPWLPHRPWHSKHASARYGEGDIYWASAAIYGDAFTAISGLRC